MSLYDLINEAFINYPKSVIKDQQICYSYAEFEKKVDRISEILKKKLQKKSKCAILCERNINTALYMLACWKSKMIPIPLSINYGRMHCDKILSFTQPNVILSDIDVTDFVNGCYLDKYVFDEINIIKMHDDYDYEIDGISDLAAIMCTSGTTGIPKGIMLTNNNFVENILAIERYFKLSETDTILIIRPLYHCAALTGEFLVSLYCGSNVVFSDNKYDPFAVKELIESFDITVLCGTPTFFNQFARIIRLKDRLNKLKKVVISGEILRKDIADIISKVFSEIEIFHVYGLTEAAPRVTYLPPELFKLYPQSIGIPLDNTEIRLKYLENDDSIVKPYEPGLLFVHSPSVMCGYYRDKLLTREKLNDEWLNTGDIAYMDEKGLLYIKSRSDNMIIRGGMNIYPSDIEEVIKNKKEVKDIVIYGQDEIIAEIVLNYDFKSLAEKEIMRIIMTNLPTYLVPDKIKIVDELIIGVTGKRKHRDIK